MRRLFGCKNTKKLPKRGIKWGNIDPKTQRNAKKMPSSMFWGILVKGHIILYNARDKNNGPTARRTKQEGEGGWRREKEGERGKEKGERRKGKGKSRKTENRKQKTENRKQESGKNRLQRVHTKGILLTIYYFFRLFSNFFLFLLGGLLIFCYLCTQKQQNMIFF